ncbi:MAG: hypothetical protein COB30_012720 [Ectothiorhodospiraceae bacterium]|nr:hypothetical protein [Ectothiorhodospiraceae bacterium]
MKTTRRKFIQGGIVGGALGLLTGSLHAKSNGPASAPTPSEFEGPFYPVIAQKDKDFDLTNVEGMPGQAKGTIIDIQGLILDTENNPVEDATIDLWQANGAGRYRHPHDKNTAPLDPNFQGWAIIQSGKNGVFRFKTVLPGAYPASKQWTRPPHIHFKVSKIGYAEIVTQMYFPEHELNNTDLLYRQKNEHEQKLMTASRVPGTIETYRYNIVLEKV